MSITIRDTAAKRFRSSKRRVGPSSECDWGIGIVEARPASGDRATTRALLELERACGGDLAAPKVVQRIASAARSMLDSGHVVIEIFDRPSLLISDPQQQQSVSCSRPGNGGSASAANASGGFPELLDWDSMPIEGSFSGRQGSVLVEPVRLKDEIIGMLRVSERHGTPGFTSADQETAELFATFIATAIGRARLIEDQQRREISLVKLNEITRLLLAGTDRTQVLHLIAQGTRDIVYADVAVVLLLTPRPSHSLIVRAVQPEIGDSLLGTEVPLGASVLGEDPSVLREVVHTGKRVFVGAESLRPQQAYQPLISSSTSHAMFLPLIQQGRPSGTVIIGRSRASPRFSDLEAGLVENFIAQASLALEHDRARREQERLAVVHDEERIARDLHDKVIQQIFATGIALQSTIRQIDDDDLAARLLQAVDVLDRTIKDIRSTIFELHRGGDDTNLRAAIARLATEFGWSCGFRAHIDVRSPPAVEVAPSISGHIVAAVQEALSNVARHAKASEVDVEVVIASDEIFVRVIDDGVGISPDVPRRSGLRNLDERVRDLGGTMSISRRGEGGSVLEWRVPLSHSGKEPA